MPQDPNNPNNPWADSWTSSNGLTTTGIQNPFGLQTNNGAVIDPYTGANAPQLANNIADNSALGSPTTNPYSGSAINPYSGSAPSGFNSPITSGGSSRSTTSSTLPYSPPGGNPFTGINQLVTDRTPATNIVTTPNPSPTNKPGFSALINNTSPATNIVTKPNVPSTPPTSTPSWGASYTKDLYGNTVTPFANSGQQSNGFNGFTDYTNPQDFIQGGLVTDQLYPNGQPQNSAQHATTPLAQQLASLVGGTVVNGQNFVGATSGQNGAQIQLPNGYTFNAGLFADLVSKYGPEQAKKILLQNDASTYGQAPTTPPGQAAQNPQVPQNGQQQPQNTFFAQLMGIYNMLNSIGAFNGRPPALPAQGGNNGNYFSQFA